MKYGYFDDTRKEYVITNPVTPWPWINYLGNRDFFLFEDACVQRAVSTSGTA